MTAHKSKTIWFGVAVSILGVVEANLGLFNLSPQAQGLVAMGIGIGIIVLRAITTMPLSEK